MDQYLALFKGKKLTVEAESSTDAQAKAAPTMALFFPRRKIRAHEIAVWLIRKGADGEVTIPASLF